MYVVQLLVQFIIAERTGHWLLHLSGNGAMTLHFFSMDQPSYTRSLLVLPSCHESVVSDTHPAVHEVFMSGNHSVSRSTQPFAQVWTDMALEQCNNRDSKTTGGIIMHQRETWSYVSLAPDTPRTSSNYNSYEGLNRLPLSNAWSAHSK